MYLSIKITKWIYTPACTYQYTVRSSVIAFGNQIKLCLVFSEGKLASLQIASVLRKHPEEETGACVCECISSEQKSFFTIDSNYKQQQLQHRVVCQCIFKENYIMRHRFSFCSAQLHSVINILLFSFICQC